MRSDAHGHVAPAERAVPLLGADAHEQLLAAQPQPGLARQERHADGVLAGRRQLQLQLLAHDAAEERVGQLQQDPGAVAGLGIGSAGTAVIHVAERLDARGDDLVGAHAVEPHDGRQTAGVMLEPRIVEASHRSESTRTDPCDSPLWRT